MDGQHNASATTVGDARRAQIVHAARAICLEKGFSKITISDIAGRVGMTRSLFYHYFQAYTLFLNGQYHFIGTCFACPLTLTSILKNLYSEIITV